MNMPLLYYINSLEGCTSMSLKRKAELEREGTVYFMTGELNDVDV